MSAVYNTHKVLLESADFHILVIEFPEADVNDKLTLLAPEKGLIYKVFYEDFVLGTCMANSSSFFYYIRRRQELYSKFEEIRAEALELIYRHNPSFMPDNVVLNDNNVLKVKSMVRPDETVRPLTSNELWDQDPPLSNFGPTVITSAPDKEDSDVKNPFLDEDEDQDRPAREGPNNVPVDNPFDTDGGGGGNGDDVPYELVGHRWKKVGIGLNVRKYEADEDSAALLLGGTPFESAKGYHLLVVHLCIEDFSDVFHLLDTMGVTKHTSPAKLVEELYNIAIEYNPFLRLESVDLKKIRAEFKKRQRSRSRNRLMSAAGNEDRTVRTSKKKFADVPAEKLLNLDTELKKHIVGQDEAVELLAEAVQRASVGLKREHEPLGCFLFTGNTGVGKCLAPGTEVLMYSGELKKVEDVSSGELLMGPDSLPRKVLSTCSGSDEMFRINPVKGESWECNAPHVLTLQNTRTGEIIDIPLNEYLEKGVGFKHLHKLFSVPVEFEGSQDLPVDPYFLGLWLGDGRKSLRYVAVFNEDAEVEEYLRELAARLGLQFSDYTEAGRCPAFGITGGQRGGASNPLLEGLRAAVDSDFRVSPAYRTSSEKERLAFLAGILDADGSLVNGCFEITQKRRGILEDTAFIARSLGFRAVYGKPREISGKIYHRLFISGDISRIPTRIPRKHAASRRQVKNVLRTGFSVEPIGRGDYYGFTLDGDGRFLLGDFTVTHNTETAKALSEVLGAPLVRVDCQEYQQPHEVAKLTGSPPGYVGYDDGGHLTKEVSKHPFSIVLFDEIEKAHNNFHERVLQILDDGVLTESKGGKKVSFKQCFIIMTSNIGVKEVDGLTKTVGFGDVHAGTEAKTAKARGEALKKKFKPEFLNRIDEIVHFRLLERDDYMHILNILLDEVGDQIKENRGISLNVTVGAKNFLIDKGINRKFGARPMRRAIKKHLNTPLAKAILKEELGEGKVSVSLSKDKDSLSFRQVGKKKAEDAVRDDSE